MIESPGPKGSGHLGDRAHRAVRMGKKVSAGQRGEHTVLAVGVARWGAAGDFQQTREGTANLVCLPLAV